MTKAKLIALLCVFSILAHSQHLPVRFQQISISDGLSLSSVYCIYRDSKGFVWMGTEDGLNRYDGYHFKIFRSNIKQANSICYKWIELVYEDSHQNLWFGSRAGLSKFDPATEVFTNYNFSEEEHHQLLNDTITNITQASRDIIFIGTVKGLNLINLNTGTINTSAFEIGRINAIKQINSNEFAIGTSQGLFYFDVKTLSCSAIINSENKNIPVESITLKGEYIWACGLQQLYKFSTKDHSLLNIYPLKNLQNQETIESILVDKQDRLWLTTNFGLYLFNDQTIKTKLIIKDYDSSHSLATDPRKPLTLDNDGVIWYGTHGSGLYLIHPSLKINKFVHNPFDKASISQNSINCIYNDTLSGNMWIGTFGAGVNIYNGKTSKFDLIKHNPINPNSLASDFIWSVFEARDSTVWVGTNDKGISRYIPSQDRFEFFDHAPNTPGSLSHSSVREIYEDSKGTIWAGTDGGGLNRYNKRLNKFTVYTKQKGNAQSLSHNSVRVVYEDSKKRLWIGTRNGLNLFNPKNSSFKRFLHNPNDPNSISHNFIYSSIIEDNDGYLWIGTYGGGLNKMNPDLGTFVSYSMSGEPGKPLSDNIVFSVHEGDDGLIWIGTNQGLNVLDKTTGLIRFWGTNDGLPNEVIYGILPDNNGNLWLSTNHGISCFNPQTEHFKNYDVHDGLQSNEFNGGAFHKGKNGRLYFGGVYGLNIITSDFITQNQYVNQPVITQLEVLGKKVMANADIPKSKHSILYAEEVLYSDKNISYTNEIILSYEQRFFSLEFSGLNHLHPNKTKYSYQLFPLDKDWHMAGKRNYVSYANVKPGKYTFKIKSSNIDGVWINKPTELKVTIQPPFWLSKWFIGIEILLIILTISFIYRFLLKIKTNKILREQNIQINAANAKLLKSESSLKQMNATKDKFFSIISHDLKNPFTGLMSISELLDQNFDNLNKDDKKSSVQKIHKSIKQVYSLLENLLTWSRSQRGTIDFNKGYFNLSSLITENINLYRLSAEKKKVLLETKGIDNQNAFGDRDSINTIIRNLTNNAIKYSKPQGKITIGIEDDSDLYWKIMISDNGVGIAEENIHKLFCIDQKLKTNGTSGEKGTGLGLIICKEFAEKNNGTIGANSTEGKGSTFWFTVPKTNKL
ncbi:hypothetical protein E9993_08500 [Labilibacter sediminis]|nr:hypothetical protein E9993_08500 [Labilibacter sediminis]